MDLILVILVFLVTSVLVVTIGSIITNQREQIKGRLGGIRKMSVDAAPEELLRQPFMYRVILPALSGLGHFVGRAAPKEIRSSVEKRITYAGNPYNLNFFSLFAIQVLLGGAFLSLSIFLFRFVQVDSGRMFLLVLLLSMVGFFIPYILISSKADSRQGKMRKNLPDVLDLLLVSVEAGLGFDMAMKKVTQQMTGPLSVEVKKALDEIRMGGNREAAFRGIARRSGVIELSSFISSVIQTEQLGSDIANTLRVQSDFMRMKRRQRAEERAMKAAVKLAFPLVFFIFPALLVVILGPALIGIYNMFITLN